MNNFFLHITYAAKNNKGVTYHEFHRRQPILFNLIPRMQSEKFGHIWEVSKTIQVFVDMVMHRNRHGGTIDGVMVL